jgi:hypothetical protein
LGIGMDRTIRNDCSYFDWICFAIPRKHKNFKNWHSNIEHK